MTVIIDGKQVANEIFVKLKEQIKKEEREMQWDLER